MSIAITNGIIFDGQLEFNEHAIIVDGDRIHSIIPKEQIPDDIDQVHDLKGDCLIPGFIDLQVNGGGGVMFNNAPTVDALRTIGEAHRQFGTTAFLPTLITTSYDVMRQAVQAVADAIDQGVPGVIGIHLEGPFLNESKKGTHDADKFCLIDEQGFELITSLTNGKTLITIAPELSNAQMIGRVVNEGVIVSMGHSNATYEQARDALQAGVSGFTHLYNGMSALQSRAPGIVGAALADKQSWFGIIADGHHSHPAAFSIAVSAKQKGGAVLVTDAMSTVGSSDGFFELNGEIIHSVDGRCVNAAGSLAGSDLDMITGVNNATSFADIDFYEAVRMASSYPARAIARETELGRIKPGYIADLVSVNKQKDISHTWIDGIINT